MAGGGSTPERKDDEVRPQGGPAGRRSHEDQLVHYSHQMSEDTAETAARVLIRAVPLIYGGILGALIDNLVLGLLLGLLPAVLLDLRMGPASLARPFMAPLHRGTCPLLATIAHGLAGAIRAAGLRPPSGLSEMQCGVSPPK